ncbi:MAG: DEAD/DEAH box helicase [Opitutales bacterium]|nr:DEAD/DEAH box helicase [Opitutales bacterium]
MNDIDVLETAVPLEVRFDSLGLSPAVIRAVEEKGYTRATPIQAEAIPLLLEGRDMIAGSQTGTGKTAAFCLPILSMLGEHDRNPRCLILEPTRELAQQVMEQLQHYGKYTGLRSALFHGGVGYGGQREALKQGIDVLVATPGRLLDHIGQRTVSLASVQFLVLDEADRMLDMGFLPDVRKIIQKCGTDRQSLLFSATIPPEIERLSKWMLKEPVEVKIGGGRQPASTIQHAIYPVDDRQKFDLLVAILKHIEYRSALIFTRTKMGADVIARWLENSNHGKVGVLHSDRSQRERENALKDFKEGRSDILVATDIVARGIDITGVSHVINYDIPQHPEDYVHRIGRTGRAEREGDAVTIYTAGEKDFLSAIERFIGQEIPKKKLEGFDYRWSPILDDSSPKKKKRNRTAAPDVAYRWQKR